MSLLTQPGTTASTVRVPPRLMARLRSSVFSDALLAR
jgi:hypothetical protein